MSKLKVDQISKATGATPAIFTLPAADGTAGQHMETDGSGQLSFATPPAGGLAEFDMFCLPTTYTGSLFPITSMTRLDFGPYGAPVGTGMGHSSGTFSFPSTGKWLITFHMLAAPTTTADSRCEALLKVSTNTGGSYTQVASDGADTPAIGSDSRCNMTSVYFMNVSNITTHLVQVGSYLESASNSVIGMNGSSPSNVNTYITFAKVAA